MVIIPHRSVYAMLLNDYHIHIFSWIVVCLLFSLSVLLLYYTFSYFCECCKFPNPYYKYEMAWNHCWAIKSVFHGCLLPKAIVFESVFHENSFLLHLFCRHNRLLTSSFQSISPKVRQFHSMVLLYHMFWLTAA